MTPIQGILLCAVIVWISKIAASIEKDMHNTDNSKIVGGLAIIGFFACLIWAIFYYL